MCVYDKIGRRCIEEGCRKAPNFAYKGEKAIYCQQHKKPDMENVVRRRCVHEPLRNSPQDCRLEKGYD